MPPFQGLYCTVLRHLQEISPVEYRIADECLKITPTNSRFNSSTVHQFTPKYTHHLKSTSHPVKPNPPRNHSRFNNSSVQQKSPHLIQKTSHPVLHPTKNNHSKPNTHKSKLPPVNILSLVVRFHCIFRVYSTKIFRTQKFAVHAFIY